MPPLRVSTTRLCKGPRGLSSRPRPFRSERSTRDPGLGLAVGSVDGPCVSPQRSVCAPTLDAHRPARAARLPAERVASPFRPERAASPLRLVWRMHALAISGAGQCQGRFRARCAAAPPLLPHRAHQCPRERALGKYPRQIRLVRRAPLRIARERHRPRSGRSRVDRPRARRLPRQRSLHRR